MSVQTVFYAYNIGQRVTVLAIERPGFVDGLSTDAKGETYRVVFWEQGQRKMEWLYEWEITARE